MFVKKLVFSTNLAHSTRSSPRNVEKAALGVRVGSNLCCGVFLSLQLRWLFGSVWREVSMSRSSMLGGVWRPGMVIGLRTTVAIVRRGTFGRILGDDGGGF